MKKTYLNPEVDVLLCSAEDILRTSGPIDAPYVQDKIWDLDFLGL